MSENRVRAVFDELKKTGDVALVAYLSHGDPSPAESIDLAIAAAQGGADIVEFGVPFSDPNADGPVIQLAMERALAAGATLSSAINGVAEMRARGCSVPVVLFGYYNPVFVYGPDEFARDCAGAGIDAVLTVDLPLDELSELSEPLATCGVGVIPLVAPTSTAPRIASVAALAAPFVYYVSMTGITGASFRGAAGGSDRVELIRKLTAAPVAVGFGIKTGEDAASVARFADGVVVGSALVSRIEAAEDSKSAQKSVREFMAELRLALGRPVTS